MTQPGSIRRMFPGSNTPKGFFSYHHYMLPLDQTVRFFIIKGGPGTGKSTFLKQVGSAISARGFDVEYHHCSADPDSIDGVVFPELGIGLVDGTHPHVIDPSLPGAADEILDFGEFLDVRGLRGRRHDIYKKRQSLSTAFRRAYRYLSAARTIYDDIEAAFKPALKLGGLNQIGSTLVEELVDTGWIGEKPGRQRRLFASAITPEGPKHFLELLMEPMERIVVIKGEPGTGKATLVERLAREILERGHDVEAFCCPFDPERMEHLIVPSLRLGVTTSTPPHQWHGRASIVVDTADVVDDALVDPAVHHIEKSRTTYLNLFQLSVEALAEAKQLHHVLETYYIPYMRFDRLEPVYQRVCDQILTLTRSRVNF